VILIALMTFALSEAGGQTIPKPPAALQLNDRSQKILRHEQEFLKAAESEHKADGTEFEVAMLLSRIAGEAADDVSVMSDMTSMEQRLSCAPDRSAVAPTVQTRMSYTIRRLDLLIKSVSSHASFTKNAGISKSAASLLEALQETRTYLAGLLSAR
jgi:hypothetical protein